MTEVAVDNEHLAALYGKRHGEVHRDEGLSGAGIEGSDRGDVGVLVLHHELDVGAEHAESFVDRIAASALD